VREDSGKRAARKDAHTVGTTVAFTLDPGLGQTTGAGGTERGAPLGAQAWAVSIAFRRAPSGAAR